MTTAELRSIIIEEFEVAGLDTEEVEIELLVDRLIERVGEEVELDPEDDE